MKRRIISVLLTVSILITAAIPVFAKDDETKREYYNVPIEFNDQYGYANSETADFMIQTTSGGKNIKVYIKAEDFAMLTGYNGYAYDQTYTECAYVDKDTAHVVRFLFGSDKVSVLYAGGELSYTAPYFALFESDVAWIPFDFAARLFDCTYSSGDGRITVYSSGLNPLSATTSVHNSMKSLAFDWVTEAGLSEMDTFINTTSASVATAASKLLSFESGAWGSVLGCVVGFTYAYDAEYAEQIAQTFIAPSMQEVQAMTSDESKLSEFADSFTKASVDVITESDDFVEDLLRDELFKGKISNAAFKNSDEFFASIQKVTDAIDKKFPSVMLSDKVRDLSISSTKKIQKIASSDLTTDLYNLYDFAGKPLVGSLKVIFAGLDILKYWNMFANKSERATAALGQYAESSQLPETQVYAEYADTSGNDFMDALKRYMLDNIDDFVSNHISLGTTAEIAGFAWDLIAGYAPFISDALDSAESNVLSQYAIRYQNESLSCYYDTRSEYIAGGGKNEEDFEKLINSAYAYLKFSFIARNAAAASYEHIEKMGINEEVMKQNVSILNDKNMRLAEYLVAMETDAFMPSENKEYNRNCDDTKRAEAVAALGTKLSKSPSQDTVPKTEITIFPDVKLEADIISEEEAISLVKKAIGRSMSGLFDTILADLYQFTVTGMYSVDGRNTYVIRLTYQDVEDDYRFFVPTDGMRVWLGMVEPDGTYFCYTGLDLLNMTWGSVMASLGDMYAEIEAEMREQAEAQAATEALTEAETEAET